ncbi:hypothetical protein DH2020_014180 [Rehmannia glutinosa]|uniref:Autophagy-related protein 11 C-terminal domain-containing protein n=1 Tax=Rehmannia glutinosa TaxID=99300 RepID=A0ABR0WZN3_REHGL
MSASASEAVVQMGKLVVHVAENGHSYKFDCDEYTLVEAVQKFLESDCGVLFNDQLLLCLDLKLESQRPLSAYKLPSDEREVFLFNKARMRSNSPHPAPEQDEIIDIPDPPLPSSSHNPHPLDDSSDPALKALPSYERQFRYHFQCGHAIYSRTLAKFETCERLLKEQKVQQKALEIARGNLDHFYKMIQQNYTDFMKCYSQQHRSHTNLLVTFGRVKEKLKSTKIIPSLQTANRKCLLDFVKEENLQKTWEDCSSSHKQFENKVSEFKQEFGDLQSNSEHLFSVKTSFLIKVLELSIKDHQRFINEQKSIMQALRSSSILPISRSHVHPLHYQPSVDYLFWHSNVCFMETVDLQADDKSDIMFLFHLKGQKLEKNDVETLVAFKSQCLSYVNIEMAIEGIKDVNTVKKLVDDCLSCQISFFRCVLMMLFQPWVRFFVFQEALKRQNDQFEHLKVVRGIGPAYRACLAEVVRRKASMKIYMGKAGQLAENIARERDAEVRRREEFLKVHSIYIPRDIIASMGLYDTPNPCDVNVTPFDSNLLDIGLSDLERYAPESLLGLSSKSEKHGTLRSSLSMSDDGSQTAEIDGTVDFRSCLRAQSYAEFDTESLDDSKLDGLQKKAAEKTSEALHLKDEYEKHLQSMLKVKQVQCESYEKRIKELEQRLSDQYMQGRELSTTKTDDNKSEVLEVVELHMHHTMEEVSSASSSLKSGILIEHDKPQEGLDDNMTDSSSMLNPQLDSSMLDLHRDKGDFCDTDKKEIPLPDGGMISSNMAVSMMQPADVLSCETAVLPGLDAKVSDNLALEVQNALAEKSSQLEISETKVQALMDEVSKLGKELEINQKLLDESQMNCAHLENCLHEAREEAQTHLCAADRRASEYSALRRSAVKMQSLFERLRSCVSSAAGVAAFADSLRALAQSLASSANDSDDDVTAESRECIRIVADKVGVLSRQRAELLDRYSKAEAANERLNKELEEKKELVNTLYVKHRLEKQANKEKISFGRLEVHEIAAFVLNSSGHYEAINRNCPYYYLSAESVALFTDHLPSHPSYIVGQVVHIERRTVKSPPSTSDQVQSNTGSTSTSNPYDLPIGCEYFVVTIAMLPDTTMHSPTS